MSSFRTQSILHILLEHHGFKDSSQNWRSRFEQVSKALGRDLQQNRTITSDSCGTPNAALQHRLFTERVTLAQSRKNSSGVFVGHLNAARLNEVQLVSRFAGFEKNLALFEPDFIKTHCNKGGGEVSCNVRMTMDLRIPLRPGGMLFISIEIT